MMRWVYAAGAAVIATVMVADIWLPVDYRLAANISLICAAVLTTTFAFLYGLRSNWRANMVGKIWMAKSVILPVMLWQIVISTWWDTDYPFRQPIRYVIYTLGALAFITMLIALWREQQRDRRELHDRLTHADDP